MDKLTSHIFKKENGQLLIEALVAISVMMVGMLAVFGVLSESLSLNRVAADQYIAANLASEGIEIVKNMIDSEYPLSAFGSSISPALGGNSKCAIDINTQPGGEGWECRSTTSALPALRLSEEWSYNLDDGNQTKFKRYVEIEMPEADKIIEVKSTVEWGRKGGASSRITVVDEFYNWRRG